MTEVALVPPPTQSSRIVSMDQFRGYTVLGMFLVSYLEEFHSVHDTFKHNEYYFSYADTIMPAFIFAVGFSFRLTILKRIAQLGKLKTYLSYIKRSLALCLISMILFGIGTKIDSFQEFYLNPQVQLHPREYLHYLQTPREQLNAELIKNQLRTPLMQAEQWKLSEGTTLTAAQLEAIDSRVTEQYKLFIDSYEKFRTYNDYQQAVQQAELQENLQRNIDTGKLTLEQLDPEQRELLHSTITFPEYTSAPFFFARCRNIAALLFKSHLWETLSIIGITQLLILPFIRFPFWIRFIVMLMFGVSHVWMTYAFNWQFLWGYTENFNYLNPNHGLNNWMGAWFETGNDRSWDGGCFGIFSWAVVMLAGSLSYDIIAGKLSRTNARKLALCGCCFLGRLCLLLFNPVCTTHPRL
ncbi:MAG: heparan-alpha-glucosaminide N-acetyltransferase domain-containing protein [Planctomycetaceae bacterium]